MADLPEALLVSQLFIPRVSILCGARGGLKANVRTGDFKTRRLKNDAAAQGETAGLAAPRSCPRAASNTAIPTSPVTLSRAAPNRLRPPLQSRRGASAGAPAAYVMAPPKGRTPGDPAWITALIVVCTVLGLCEFIAAEPQTAYRGEVATSAHLV